MSAHTDENDAPTWTDNFTYTGRCGHTITVRSGQREPHDCAEKGLPLIERCAAKAVGRALIWLGKRAHDRGDTHAYGHALAALRAGDCANSGCPIPPVVGAS